MFINIPDDLAYLKTVVPEETAVHTQTNEVDSPEFVLVFVTKKAEIDTTIAEVAPLLTEETIFWYCYPKKSSKKYKCDFNRDTGWESMGEYNLEPVRQVAIDEDWSALRFRNVNQIKKITRRESFALTKEAKERTFKKGQ